MLLPKIWPCISSTCARTCGSYALKLDSKYVTKAEFNPVRLIAYGLVSVLLVAVISALIGKVGI
jgi:hypothetical protein